MVVIISVGILIFGLAQIFAGFVGIDHYFGAVWAVGAIAVACFLRFSLLISVAAFFGARDVWGWHWTVAAVFAAPGLLFMMPGFFVKLKAMARG